MNRPVAIGPTSKTVIGEVVGTGAPKKKPFPWKRLAVPAGIAGAIWLALRYKGHV